MIRTKIIATLGPASDSLESIESLVDAGVDVFRLNFSHGTLEQHARTFANVRKVCERRGGFQAVMADLCGPKIRVDSVEKDAFTISVGDTLEIADEHIVGSSACISTNRPEIVREVAVGHRVLIDDGSVLLRVERTDGRRLHCVCEAGGKIGSRKGINLPDSEVQMSALTDKDRTDLAWALQNGVDYVAMSFVRSAADLHELRALLPAGRDTCRIVAKIETGQAISRLDEIIAAADVVLVARGDLGVEVDLAKVPLLQKDISRKCHAAGRPVIIATQMLHSMVTQPTATRAEVSDVANAILDGADALMLSAETSIGAFPVASVRLMERIARETETYEATQAGAIRTLSRDNARATATAVAHGASLLAEELGAKLVAVWTETGNTARLLSKCRLQAPIVGMSPDEHVCRRMAMCFGVTPVQLRRDPQILTMLREVDEMIVRRGLAAVGDLVVVIAGTHLDQVGSTNALLIHLVGSSDHESARITG